MSSFIEVFFGLYITINLVTYVTPL